jgi:hypothetical protein
MKYYNKNNFGNEFNKLPIELQKEIMLQNATYYQKIVADLLIDYAHLDSNYKNKLNELQDLRKPESFLHENLEIYENKNRRYSKQQIKRASYYLHNVYMPLISKLKDDIKTIKNNLISLKEKIDKNKKMYYFYYHNYKKQ